MSFFKMTTGVAPPLLTSFFRFPYAVALLLHLFRGASDIPSAVRLTTQRWGLD